MYRPRVTVPTLLAYNWKSSKRSFTTSSSISSTGLCAFIVWIGWFWRTVCSKTAYRLYYYLVLAKSSHNGQAHRRPCFTSNYYCQARLPSITRVRTASPPTYTARKSRCWTIVERAVAFGYNQRSIIVCRW